MENDAPVRTGWVTIGTGFYWGRKEKDDPDVKKREYSAYLITAGHVVRGYIKLFKDNPLVGPLKIRVNPTIENLQGVDFDLHQDLSDPGVDWMFHESEDVAALPINLGMLREKNFASQFFPDDLWIADRAKLKEIGTSEGDGVFVLGFPMGMAGNQKNYVIVRQGVIARIAEMIDRGTDYFLIDSFVFPGNSGGPVILRPEGLGSTIIGTKTNNNAYLIGLVIEEISYVDTAVSQQTGRARITFEENSGLGKILPVDYIRETVEVARAAQANAAQAPAAGAQPRPKAKAKATRRKKR